MNKFKQGTSADSVSYIYDTKFNRLETRRDLRRETIFYHNYFFNYPIIIKKDLFNKVHLCKLNDIKSSNFLRYFS